METYLIGGNSMTGNGIISAIFAVLLTAMVSCAFDGEGCSYGSATMDQLMPSPPTNATVTAGNREACVSFTPPQSDGGSPVTRFDVTSPPGNINASGNQSPIAVKGLTNGSTCTLQ